MMFITSTASQNTTCQNVRTFNSLVDFHGEESLLKAK